MEERSDNENEPKTSPLVLRLIRGHVICPFKRFQVSVGRSRAEAAVVQSVREAGLTLYPVCRKRKEWDTRRERTKTPVKSPVHPSSGLSVSELGKPRKGPLSPR